MRDLHLMGLDDQPPFRGQSLLDEVFGIPAEELVIVVDFPHSELVNRRRAVIDERGYKIVAFGDDRGFELYDREKDLWEKEELGKSQPGELERMQKTHQEPSAKIPVVDVVGSAKLEGAAPGQRY